MPDVVEIKKFDESVNEETEPVLRTTEDSRITDELVFGLVGAIGAGVSKTATELKSILETQFKYKQVKIIKVSDLIRESATRHLKEDFKNLSAMSGAERIKKLQESGKKLRKKFGADYLAKKAIQKIALQRELDEKASRGKGARETDVPYSERNATIIDSLKHQDETQILRRVYNTVYWQLTVFAPEEIRETRLSELKNAVRKEEIVNLFTTDEDGEGDHSQKVSKTAHLSDFFIRNDGESVETITKPLNRFMNLLFGIGVNTPTVEEAGMYNAMAAANKSACMSRQVGASIYSNKNELVSVGWNDVPRAKGGLYTFEDDEKDKRCFRWKNHDCHNDLEKKLLYSNLYEELKKAKVLGANVCEELFVSVVSKKTRIKNLIEFSRSIHAEMEAIVSAGRTGKIGMVEGTLFTTTFPCHNCARHIVAAGIVKVYYIEPYSKSLATKLHSDSISTKQPSDGKVLFLQYEGVGPNSLLKLFQNGEERKKDGKLALKSPENAKPIHNNAIDGFTLHEGFVINKINIIENEQV